MRRGILRSAQETRPFWPRDNSVGGGGRAPQWRRARTTRGLSARPPRCHRQFAPGDTLGGSHEMLGEPSRREETPTHGSLALPWSLPSARAHKPRAALGRSGDCCGAEPRMEGALRIRQWRRKTRPPSARSACECFLPGHTAKLALLNTNKETKPPPHPPKKTPPALLNVYKRGPVR